MKQIATKLKWTYLPASIAVEECKLFDEYGYMIHSHLDGYAVSFGNYNLSERIILSDKYSSIQQAEEFAQFHFGIIVNKFCRVWN